MYVHKLRSRRLTLKWTHEDIILLIECVKESPILWAISQRESIEKHRRWKWFSVNKFNKRISPTELNQKWQNLRSQFYEYINKIRYTPNKTGTWNIKWKYFPKLLFLLDHNRRIKVCSQVTPKIDHAPFLIENVKPEEPDPLNIENCTTTSISDEPEPPNIAPTDLQISCEASIAKNTSSIGVQTEEVMEQISHSTNDAPVEILEQTLKHIPIRPNDESQVFGDYVAIQMRRLSEHKRHALEFVLQKFILSTLTEPELNQEIRTETRSNL